MANLAASRDSVLAELERVLESPVFESAGRSRTLLKFVVEETLNGRADRLKEYTIGTEALDKGGSFDPRTDPIVRAEISRLRTRLDHYFADAGRWSVRHKNLGVDLWHVGHAQNLIVVEIGRLRSTVLERQFLEQRSAQPERNSTFELGMNVLRLHGDARVDRHPNIVDFDLSGLSVKRDLHHAGGEGAVIV